MGGPRSSLFQAYRKLCVRTFLSFRKRRDDVIVMVEMMLAGNPDIPGFRGGPDAVMDGLHARFLPGASKRAAARHVHSLIDQSYGSWRTSLYDKYQRCCEGIL
jgi:phosphatidylinositol kinase/protein kinase (PI-3  family)